jgi:acetylornithine/N-succinyldiaminopimelate aminotransferase
MSTEQMAGPVTTGPVTTGSLQERYAAVMMQNYGTPPVALARGEGCVVWDVDGKSYLDLIGGIAVSALGHGHPAIVAAVSEQVARLAHISNLFLHEGQVVLAERLLGLLGAPDGRVFFANSGTEANEAAFKLVRRMQGAARPVYVAAEGGFHGRSTGSLGLTGKSSIRDPFAPFGVDVRFVPFGDQDALTAAIGPDCAAVFLEPCLGEGGIVPAPAGYLKAARAACDAAGALLVLDEIQSGIGRTGAWFACQEAGVVPDVLTLAKGLGGGLPIGACIGIGAAATGLQRGDHGSTFGGNPVACAAALAVLDVIERDGLLENVAQVGAVLSDGIGAVRHPLLVGVRGSGLWLAMALTSPSASLVEAAAREAGFLVNAVQPDAVRIAPPLVLSADQARTFLAALPGILKAAAAGSAPRAGTAGGSGGSSPRASTAGGLHG